MGKKNVRSFPASYTTLDLDISLPKNEIQHISALNTYSQSRVALRSLDEILVEGYKWLETVKDSLSKNELEFNEWISWAAYHASRVEPPTAFPATSYMLPLFTESPNNATMVWHGMKVISRAIANINPDKTSVMEIDQPLFTLAKKLPWRYHDS